MLRLQRTVIAMHHQFRYIVHQIRITLDFRFIRKILRKNKVQIAVQRMSVNNTLVITMLIHGAAQIERSFRQMFQREGDVFNQHRRAGWSHIAHSGEHIFTNVPVALILRFHRGKLNRHHGWYAL